MRIDENINMKRVFVGLQQKALPSTDKERTSTQRSVKF